MKISYTLVQAGGADATAVLKCFGETGESEFGYLIGRDLADSLPLSSYTTSPVLTESGTEREITFLEITGDFESPLPDHLLQMLQECYWLRLRSVNAAVVRAIIKAAPRARHVDLFCCRIDSAIRESIRVGSLGIHLCDADVENPHPNIECRTLNLRLPCHPSVLRHLVGHSRVFIRGSSNVLGPNLAGALSFQGRGKLYISNAAIQGESIARIFSHQLDSIYIEQCQLVDNLPASLSTVSGLREFRCDLIDVDQTQLLRILKSCRSAVYLQLPAIVVTSRILAFLADFQELRTLDLSLSGSVRFAGAPVLKQVSTLIAVETKNVGKRTFRKHFPNAALILDRRQP